MKPKGPRRRRAASPAVLSPEPVKWTVYLPPTILARLKVRAAQEQRTIRDTLHAALVAYLATPLPPTAVAR